MESKWTYSAHIDTPTFVYIDFEGIKYSPSKSKTHCPALCKRWEGPTSHFYLPTTTKKLCRHLLRLQKNHSLSFIFSLLWQNPIPMQCCSGSLQKLFVPLQASPSASENLGLITNVFLMHRWKHLLKIISFSLRQFSIKQTHNNYFL